MLARSRLKPNPRRLKLSLRRPLLNPRSRSDWGSRRLLSALSWYIREDRAQARRYAIGNVSRSIALIEAKGRGGHAVRGARILGRGFLSSVDLGLSLNLATTIEDLLVKSRLALKMARIVPGMLEQVSKEQRK
jgi:hypothetical protein